MLGLEEAVTMDVADGQSDAGWVMLNGTSCAPWSTSGGGGGDASSTRPFFLHSVYQLSDPLGTTRITMPVLFDKK